MTGANSASPHPHPHPINLVHSPGAMAKGRGIEGGKFNFNTISGLGNTFSRKYFGCSDGCVCVCVGGGGGGGGGGTLP